MVMSIGFLEQLLTQSFDQETGGVNGCLNTCVSRENKMNNFVKSYGVGITSYKLP